MVASPLAHLGGRSREVRFAGDYGRRYSRHASNPQRFHMDNYRSSENIRPDRDFEYGPFPAARSNLIIIAVGLVIGLGVVIEGLSEGRLSCGPTHCNWRPRHWFSAGSKTVERPLLRGVTTQRRKDVDNPKTEIRLDAGPQTVLIANTTSRRALAFRRTVNDALAKSAPTFTATLPAQRGMAYAGLAGILICLGVLIFTLGRRGTVHVHVGPRTVAIRRRRWGRLGPATELSTVDIAGVELDVLKDRDNPFTVRVVLELNDGTRRPLSAHHLPPGPYHEAFREELSHALESVRPRARRVVTPDV